MSENESAPKRLAPQAPHEWSAQTRRLFGYPPPDVGRAEPRDAPLAILRTIAHHPRLLEPFLRYAATLAGGGVLARRDSELLALRTAWNCRSAFEWGHHVEYAQRAGLDDEEIERVAAGPDADGWSEADRALLQAADELHADQDVADETWAALRERFDDAQLVEIPFVVGHYTMLSMVARATGVPLEPDLAEMPDAPG